MKRASRDTIDNHYRESYPGPHYAMGIHHAFRAGWQDCENQIDTHEIVKEAVKEFMKWYTKEFDRIDSIPLLEDFTHWLYQEESK